VLFFGLAFFATVPHLHKPCWQHWVFPASHGFSVLVVYRSQPSEKNIASMGHGTVVSAGIF